MRLIQISAWNDSGGGFMHRLFDGHRQLRVWPFELLLGRDDLVVDRFDQHWFKGRFRWPRLAIELATENSDILFEAISDAELKVALDATASSKHAAFPVDISLAEWRSVTRIRWAHRQESSQAEFLRCYIDAFFEVFGRAEEDKKPILGHCPAIILDAPEMWADFPDGKIVHVIRSPIGGFIAMKARHPGLDPISYGRKWALVNGAAAMWAGKRPDQVVLVAVKSLIEQRERTLRHLIAWLGLDFDESLLTPTWCGQPLDESRMGPFGGVANMGEVLRDDDPPTLTADARAKLEAMTSGVKQILNDLNVIL